MSEICVASTREVKEGTGMLVEVGDKRIAVFCHKGEYFALDDLCPHKGGSLHQGAIHGAVVSCPWHQWQFDIRTGVSPVNPLSQVRAYPVRVEGTSLYVEID